ncbi:MAG TPA: hypothetical protein VN939_00015, partial [Chthoniobacterales bacterium]|nr:hypothetical protein [Chthoniobacterales bacterium]
ITFIKANPGWYAWTSLRRAFFMWSGYWSLEHWYLEQEPLDPANIVFCSAFTVLALIGLRRAWKGGVDAAVLYTIVLVIFPLTYYITSPEFYYRRPIDPMMVVLAVYGLTPLRRLDGAGVGSPGVGSQRSAGRASVPNRVRVLSDGITR